MVLGAAVALVAAGYPAAVAAAASCPGADVVATSDAERRQALGTIRCLVNAERAKRGAARLKRSGSLAGVAHAQSADMARFQVRCARQSSRAGRRRTGRPLGVQGQARRRAIGWGSGTRSSPDRLMRALMADAAHRRVVRSSRYRDIGVGLVLEAPVTGTVGGATLTLVLGRRR